MGDARQLAQVAALSAASLVLAALAVGLLLAVLEAASPSELWRLDGAFRTGILATLLIGAGPTLLAGAPAYWWLRRLGRARCLTVVPLGAGLGSLVAVLEPALLGFGMGCGTIVAALTHGASRRWLAPVVQK